MLSVQCRSDWIYSWFEGLNRNGIVKNCSAIPNMQDCQRVESGKTGTFFRERLDLTTSPHGTRFLSYNKVFTPQQLYRVLGGM